MKIKKDDTVLVITGKDKGKKGKVRFAYPDDKRIMVEGINMIKKHTKAKPQVRQAGIIEREAPISVADVMLICANAINRPELVIASCRMAAKPEFAALAVRWLNNVTAKRKI